MGTAYICRRTPYTQEFEEQLGAYPVGVNGLLQGNVIVLDNTTSLSKYLFMDNPQVTNVNLPNTILSFDNQAFKNCSKITRVDVPDEVRVIPSECFMGCSSLNYVTLPKSLMSIADNAFRNCISLRTVVFQNDNLYPMGAYCFSNCNALLESDLQKIASLLSSTPGEGAFSSNNQLQDFSINYIGYLTFSDCRKLNKVTILHPNMNGTLAERPFVNCDKLETVVLPDGTVTIAKQMFDIDNTSLTNNIKNVNVPNGCTSIETKAFYRCANLKNLFIPSSVTYIGQYAFSYAGCQNLIVDSDASLIVDENAFSYSNIEQDAANSILSNEKNEVRGNAFYSCNAKLGKLIIKCFINSKYRYHFSYCSNGLSEVEYYYNNYFLDNNKNTIPVNMFDACSNLTKAIIHEGFTKCSDSICRNCTNLKTVRLPSSIVSWTKNCNVSTDERYAILYNCSNLEDVQLGEEENKWTQSLRLTWSNKITVESMKQMFKNLAPLSATGPILYLGETNLSKLNNDEEALELLRVAREEKKWTIS